jgi:hypothetical protein
VSAALTEAPRPAVAGYVEAITANAALGWAWTPGQAQPLTVELRLGPEVVAEAVADGLRPDLARSGIGEGRHAFTLKTPEALRSRLADLRVFARTADGAAVPLGSVPAEDGVAERLVQLSRGMEMLIGSQRVLHRNVQAALLAAPQAGAQAGASALADVAASQAALADSVTTLELFVVRLEQGMAALAAQRTRTAQPRWALGGLAALSTAALVLSAWALLHVMPA